MSDRTALAPLAWLEAHCLDSDGRPRTLTPSELGTLADHFTVNASGAFVNADRSHGATILAGLLARRICAAEPAFTVAGFAEGSEEYACADNGCPCGWSYRYAPGEPVMAVA